MATDKKPVYLESLGRLAVLASAPVATVQAILEEIGAKPAFVINGVPHYTGPVCGTVMARANGWTDQAAYHRRFDGPGAETSP